jgi:hypothetical protein
MAERILSSLESNVDGTLFMMVFTLMTLAPNCLHSGHRLSGYG